MMVLLLEMLMDFYFNFMNIKNIFLGNYDQHGSNILYITKLIKYIKIDCLIDAINVCLTACIYVINMYISDKYMS